MILAASTVSTSRSTCRTSVSDPHWSSSVWDPPWSEVISLLVCVSYSIKFVFICVWLILEWVPAEYRYFLCVSIDTSVGSSDTSFGSTNTSLWSTDAYYVGTDTSFVNKGTPCEWGLSYPLSNHSHDNSATFFQANHSWWKWVIKLSDNKYAMMQILKIVLLHLTDYSPD